MHHIIKFTILLNFFFMTCSHAINCKHASLAWEKMVCSDRELLRLDKELNHAYRQCSGEGLVERQKEWLETLVPRKDSLKEEYRERILRLKLCAHTPSYSYIKAKPGDNEDQPLADRKDLGKIVPYHWAAAKYNGEVLIQYPVLTQKSAYTNQINAEIVKIKDEFSPYIFDIGCRSPISDFKMSVVINNSDFFGILYEVSSWDTCTAGVGRDSLITFNNIWDLKTGADLKDIYHFPIDVNENSIPQLKVILKKYVDSKYWPKGCSVDEMMENATGFKFAFSDDKNMLVWNAFDGDNWRRWCGYYGDPFQVPLEQVKAYITLNEDFREYLPRFLRAGLISRSHREMAESIYKTGGRISPTP